MYTGVVRRRLGHWFAIVCAVGCAATSQPSLQSRPVSSRAEAPADTQPLIRVTAVVTDKRGQVPAGLKPADFELLVDGKPQTVDTVELITPTASPRAFAFLLDEFHTTPGDSAAVRDGLLRFIDSQLRPADLAFVVKPLDSLIAINPAMNRDAVRSAVSTFEGRKGDYTPRTTFERQYMAQAPVAVAFARGQIVTSALRAIGVALAQTTNVRPTIVLVSDGFERMRTSREVPANLQTAVRIANRADAPVYAFSPAPILPPTGDPPSDDPGITALRALTAQTGGDLVIGASALETGLMRMTRDMDKHYVLTYRAAHGSDGRFHALQVGIKRQGVQIRTRGGYVAPISAEAKAALTPAPAAPLRVVRRSALIQSWFGLVPLDGDRLAVTLTWEPSSLRATDPRGRASTIMVTAATPDGAVLFDGPVAPAGDAATADVPNRVAFEAGVGAVRIDMKILDAKGVVVDTDARDITIPRARKDTPTVFPPAVIRTRSAREFRDALQRPATAPVATRDFRRTDRLLIRVPAVDASGLPVPVAAALLNRVRQPMRTLTPIEDAAAPAGITQFDVPLSSLAPGEYTVRFTVTHAGGSVSEHVTFRVQG